MPTAKASDMDPETVLKAGKKFEILPVPPPLEEMSADVRIPCETCEKEANDLSCALLLKGKGLLGVDRGYLLCSRE